MESGRLKICPFAFVFGIIVLCSSCNATVSFWSPYSVTESHVVVGKEIGVHKFAGAYIDVVNNSDRVIQSGVVSFMVFDSNGKSCGIPSLLSASVDLGLMPGEEKQIILSLDDVLGANVDRTYKLDFVHFTRLNYEDGSCWIDPLGVSVGW